MAHITNYAPGGARHCVVWQGLVWLGLARLQGEIPALCSNGIIMTNYTPGSAGQGVARRCGAMQGKGTGLQNPVHYA